FIQIPSISSFSFPQQLSLFGIAKVGKFFIYAKLFCCFFENIFLLMIPALTLIKKVTTKIGQVSLKKQIQYTPLLLIVYIFNM
ncbi:TPA: hypothetical protein ACW7X5_003510, partial [Elizabethkingia meningoseptica]